MGMTPPWWYIPIRTPAKALKRIQAPINTLLWRLLAGRLMLERMSGMQGRRNRASWWEKKESMTVAERAEKRRMEGLGLESRRGRAGRARIGRLTRKC